MTKDREVTSGRWSIQKISEVTTKVGSGATPRGGESVYQSSGVPLIRSMNVHSSGFKPDGLVFIDADEAKKLGHVIVQPNDVLLNITGASIGRVTTAPKSLAGSRVNQHVCIIRPMKELLPAFLAYYMASPEQQARVMNVQVGATRQALTKAMILDWEVPVPSFHEQQGIVAEIEKQFSRLDEAIANLKRVKANLKRYKSAVLKAAVEGALVPIKNRQTTKIGEVADLVTKGSSPNWQGFTYADTGVVFVRSQNVGWGNLNLSDVAHLPLAFNEKERKSILKTGDVLLNIVGASIGRAAVASPEVEGGNVNQAVAVIRLNKERMLPKYLMLNLLSPGTQAAIHAEKVDVARANVSLSDIKDFSVLFPSLAEQGTMVAEVERRLSVIDEIETTVEANFKRAERLHQSILQQAFSGQLVPEDPKVGPVPVLLESVRVESSLGKPRSAPRQREASIMEAEETMTNLIEALKGTSDWITAQEAFRLCGVGDGTETDAIERVYEELRDHISSGRVAIARRGEEDWIRFS